MSIAIIGAGAAGLMAAAAVHELNPETEIFLIERNNGLGKKVIISGGGRCNVTTGIQDVRTVLTKYPRGNKFLSSAIYRFPPKAVYDWFESHSVPLKTEEDLRVFPISNNGKDIVGVFEELFHDSRIHVRLNTSVTHIEKPDGQFSIFFKEEDEPLYVDKIILTTGGQAYRHTGSTGDGYAFAASLGHTITPLAPSLNSFSTKETWPEYLSGLSFEKATLSTSVLLKKISFTGPFLFTHKGMSGPAVFALSSIIAFETYDKAHPLELHIDLLPDLSLETIQKDIVTGITNHPKKSFENILSLIIPKSLAEICLHEQKISNEKRGAEISKKQILECATWLKGIPLHIIGRGAGDEFVTAGGVETKEVNPSTMESLICPGLYFGGEILNIDGFTGGFNLQASWATGHLAGESI